MNGHARRRLDQIRHDAEIDEIYEALKEEAPPGKQQDHLNKVFLGLQLEHHEDHRKGRIGGHSLAGIVGAFVVGVISNLDRVVR